MTAKLTTWKQVGIMRRKWPGFRVVSRDRGVACWEGQLRPLSRPYTAQILLRSARKNDADESALPVRVTVIDPLLHRRTEDPADPIPHHYPNSCRPELPILCLYDPLANQWNQSRAIATTIVPWTIDWLACYEGWLATGEWSGGGRHPPVE